MESAQYDVLERVQSDHWFYDFRRTQIAKEIEIAFPGRRDLRILDFGAGMGANTPTLQKYGRVTCIEAEPAARTHLSGTLDFEGVYSNFETLREAKAGDFDFILVSYVLYHRDIAKPVETLRNLAKIASRSAVILVLEPAFNSLKRSMDERTLGVRRFRRNELSELLREAGWKTDAGKYLLPSLFPVVWALARIDQMRRPSAAPPPEQQNFEGRTSRLFARLWIGTVDYVPTLLRVPFGIGVMLRGRRAGHG